MLGTEPSADYFFLMHFVTLGESWLLTAGWGRWGGGPCLLCPATQLWSPQPAALPGPPPSLPLAVPSASGYEGGSPVYRVWWGLPQLSCLWCRGGGGGGSPGRGHAHTHREALPGATALSWCKVPLGLHSWGPVIEDKDVKGSLASLELPLPCPPRPSQSLLFLVAAALARVVITQESGEPGFLPSGPLCTQGWGCRRGGGLLL